MIVRQRAICRPASRPPECRAWLAKSASVPSAPENKTPPPATMNGLAAPLSNADRVRQFVDIRTNAALRPDLLGKEALRIIVGLGLRVLAQGQRHGAAFGRIGQHIHGALQRRHDLLGPRDAVEIARHRPEAIVGRDRAVGEILDLLQAPDRAGGWRTRRPAAAAPAGGSHGPPPPPSPCWWRRGRWMWCRPSCAAGARLWRRRSPHAPCPARYGRGRSEACRACRAGLRPCRPHCRGRRSPRRRRRAAESRHRCRSSAPRETGQSLAPW